MKLLSLLLLSFVSLSWALSSLQTKKPSELIVLRDANAHCEILSFRETQVLRGVSGNAVYTTRQTTTEGGHRTSYISYNVQATWDEARAECANDLTERLWGEREGEGDAQHVLGMSPTNLQGAPPPDMKVSPLVVSGPSSNRVDLVFFSDGYLAEEYDKFIEDAKRLADDLSGNHTFNTVKPLLNFWAAFTPSKESGVGTGGKPLDTIYGLYRPGTELRGVLYTKPEVARAACLSLGDRCDYPILMGNDPLYGGLGGEFTVITPSIANGALVLRHELGHSIIDVGEEYDGAEDWDHFGVNSHPSLATPVSWAHWLTNSSSAPKVREERSVMPLQDYAWTMLNTTTSWSANFSASGQYARSLFRFSLSGLPEESDLTVEVDGKDLGWQPKIGLGVDRWHYDIYRDGGLSDGEHEIKFTLNNADREGIAQLCSVEVLEFGDEIQFNSTPGHYSLYPTFSDTNQTYYRPTNEDCLMRIVTTPDFCSVCMEDLWLKVLRRVDLIDDIHIGPVDTASKTHTVSLSLAPLAELRDVPVPETESWFIQWYKGSDGKTLDEFTNKTTVELDTGYYSVDVRFFTEEIRVDKEGLTTSHRHIFVGET